MWVTCSGYEAFPAGSLLHRQNSDFHAIWCESCRVGKIYSWLGLTVAVVESNKPHAQNRPMFMADITFVTGQELCFTFLKDQTIQHEDDIVRSRALWHHWDLGRRCM